MSTNEAPTTTASTTITPPAPEVVSSGTSETVPPTDPPLPTTAPSSTPADVELEFRDLPDGEKVQRLLNDLGKPFARNKEETPPSDVITSAPPPTPAPVPERVGLRLRLKVWVDPATRQRFLMPTAIIADPARGLMTAYAMSDVDTRVIQMTVEQWNQLPFYYFQEDGEAPRATKRPVDVISTR